MEEITVEYIKSGRSTPRFLLGRTLEFTGISHNEPHKTVVHLHHIQVPYANWSHWVHTPNMTSENPKYCSHFAYGIDEAMQVTAEILDTHKDRLYALCAVSGEENGK